MRRPLFANLLFILYCVEAGAFLLIAPWTPAWDRSLVHLSFDPARLAALHPLGRGLASGFGLVHLVWGAHDLDLWLGQGRSRGGSAS